MGRGWITRPPPPPEIGTVPSMAAAAAAAAPTVGEPERREEREELEPAAAFTIGICFNRWLFCCSCWRIEFICSEVSNFLTVTIFLGAAVVATGDFPGIGEEVASC